MNVPRGRGVLVGRENVLHTLRLATDDALTGRGGLVLLAGEPGVGKTRMAEEISDYARSLGAVVAWGGCWEGEGTPGFWPWLQVLRSLTRAGDGSSLLRDLSAITTEMSHLVPEPTTSTRQALGPLIEIGQERFRLFDAVGEVLRTVFRAKPILVVLDDLHWSDAPSLRLLRFLAQDLRTSPVLILGAYRDVEVDADGPLAQMLGELTWGQHIPLRGLTQQDVTRLVAAVSGVQLSEQAAETVRASTDGNPFFIREIVSSLTSQDSLLNDDDMSPDDLIVPGGLTAVINRRVDRLRRPSIRLLQAGAVLGQEFELDVVSAVLDQPDEMSLAQATDAIRARLLTSVPGAPTRLRFVHNLVRHTLHSELEPSRRVDLHARAAEVIERRHRDDLAPRLAEVAHHLWVAGTDPGKAAEYTVEAGRAAMHEFAYEEAVHRFTRAVEILENSAAVSAVRRCDVMLLLADAQLATGNTTAARKTLKDAAFLAQRADAPDRLAHAALAVGTVYTFGLLDNLEIGLLQAALKTLPESETKLRARVLARLAKALVLTPDLDSRTRLSEQAVRLARNAGDREVLGWVLVDRLVAIWGFTPVPERLDIATRIVRLAEQIDDRNLLVRGRVLRMANLLELGDMPGYATEVQTFEQLVRKHRMIELRWHVSLLRATEAHIAGRLAEARRLSEEGLALGRRVNRPDIDMWSLVASIPMFWQGRSQELESPVRQLIDAFPNVPALRTLLALILVETGRADDAAIELERLAGDRFARIVHDFTWLANMAGLAAVCHCLGDRARAEILYDLLSPHASYLVRASQIGVGCSGPVEYYLGLLAITLDREDEAVHHIEATIATSDRIGAPVFAAQARAKLADCLEARGRGADRQRIDQLRRQAKTTMQALGVRQNFQPVTTPPQDVHATSATLQREGEYWTIRHSTDPVRIRDRVGMRYLARLLTEPGREYHVLDLVAGHSANQNRVSNSLGPVLDDKAKAAYRQRLAELDEDLREAEAFGDQGRVEAIRRDVDALTDQLTAAVGLGGRDRQPGSDAERARTAVTKAIRSVIAHIGSHDPVLGGHLSQAVKTGTYCTYTPDPTAPLHWTF
ncbi:ATP-binding protein [Actinophytocola sp.]|uniref:ATP-binding protein n=1 Tax=Actinophytocola sp. TaxID=1872138 RepID=UPI002ED4AC0B